MIQRTQKSTGTHFQVLIIGGGAAGISVAARLCKDLENPDIAIFDPSDKHYYQPLWTLVGGGVTPKETTERSQASVIPEGATWIKQGIVDILPDDNAVIALSGDRFTYDYLVVAPGIQIDWDKIPGLSDNVGRDGLCSNYSYQTVDSTWESIKNFQGGTAIFTHPATPIKCGGAPQKIMYLAADYWKKNPPAHPYNVVFCIATPTIFSVPIYAETLVKIADRYGIEVLYQHDLSSIDAEERVATFKRLDGSDDATMSYSMMHVTPPMSAPDFIKRSPLANAGGWADADKHSLQHPKYSNVFCIGDASGLPISKTGAAIRKQAPTLANNLLSAIRSRPMTESYDGYTSCPLVTGYGKLVLAEFDYDGNRKETFPFDQNQERLSMYMLKRHVLPRFYWDGMLKGRA